MNISVTDLVDYWKCGQYFNLKKQRKLKRFENIPMLVGTSVHAGAEHGVSALILGEKPNLTMMKVAAITALDKTFDKVEVDPLDEISGRRDMIYRQAIAKIERALTVYHGKELHMLTPIAAEQKIRMPWGAHVITGVIDRVGVDEAGALTIDDLKVGSARPPDKDTAEKSAQLAIYALIWWDKTGKMPERGTLTHFVDGKRPHYTVRDVYFTERGLEAMRLRVNRTLAAIDAGVYTPGDPFFTCNAHKCAAWSICDMGAGLQEEADA